MEITLRFITNIYSTPDKNGKQKILKRNLKFRETVNTCDIKGIREYISDSGKIDKNKAVLILNDKDDMRTLDMPFEEAQYLKINKEVIGFRRIKTIKNK